jgi:cytochrome P450
MISSAAVYSPPACHAVICVFFCSPDILETNYLDHSWRRTRRAAHEGLTKVAVRDYHPILRKEAILLSSALLENPNILEKHFQRFAASTIMSILYDYPTLQNEHDKTLTDIHAFIDRVSAAAAPGAHLVELFPWMMYIPERYVSPLPTYF